jgi:hypothetical protein
VCVCAQNFSPPHHHKRRRNSRVMEHDELFYVFYCDDDAKFEFGRDGNGPLFNLMAGRIYF